MKIGAHFNAASELIGGSNWNNRFLFTGREHMLTFSVYEYRNRAYHPGLGRFMSEDPKLFVHRIGVSKEPEKWDFLKHPDDGELNLFRYVGNDPLDLTDPMGLEFNGDLSATEVERIEGNKFGITAVAITVAPVEQKDGNFRLQLNVTVVRREVARKVKWHGRGRETGSHLYI